MTSAKYDLVYLVAGIDSLQDFLLVEDLFWPIGVNPPSGEPPFPRLTIGGLLLSRERLKARRLPLDQEAQFDKLLTKMQSVTTDWKIAWQKKATRAFQMRLNMWRDFIEDYRKEPESNADRYVYEVRLRVILHLLIGEGVALRPAEDDLLNGLDLFLRAVLVSGNFIWETELTSGFRHDEYWYLFGDLPDEL